MVQTSIFVSFKNYLGDSSLVKVLTDIREGRYEPPVLELRKKLSDGDKDGAEQIRSRKGYPPSPSRLPIKAGVRKLT